ncbi:MAG: DNA repair protein RadC [Cyanobacteria bacterium P01_E01_bin.6]
MPYEEHPRSQVLDYGARNRTTVELMAVLIGSGSGSKSATEIAQTLLAHLETTTAEGALRALRDISAEELQQVEGVGPSKAAAILAAVELGKRVYAPGPMKGTIVDDPAIAAAAFTKDLMWEPKEKFGVLHLNIKHRIIGRSIISVGSATETIAQPRDVFRTAIQRGAARVIVAHNHPSMCIDPSSDDLALTQQLIASGKMLGIPVLDHLILGGGSFRSLRQTTMIWSSSDM